MPGSYFPRARGGQKKMSSSRQMSVAEMLSSLKPERNTTYFLWLEVLGCCKRLHAEKEFKSYTAKGSFMGKLDEAWVNNCNVKPESSLASLMMMDAGGEAMHETGSTEVYSETYLNSYPLDKPYMLVKSGMGTGKTTKATEYLERTNPKRVLIISPRIQFTQTLKALFEKFEFVCYNDEGVVNIAKHDRIIVQYESLYKLHGVEPFDLVMIDELHSVLTNVYSSTNKGNSFCNSNLFEVFIKSAKVFLGCDADLGNRGIETLAYILEPDDLARGLKRIHFIHNIKKPPPKTYIFYQSMHEYEESLVNNVRVGQKTVACFGSKKFADNVRDKLIQRFKIKEEEIKYYSKDTGDMKDFKDISASWGDASLIMYTPKVTVGADYTVNDVEHMYLSCDASSATATTMMQMIGRVRNPLTDTVHVYIEERKTKRDRVPKTADQIWKDFEERGKSVRNDETALIWGDQATTVGPGHGIQWARPRKWIMSNLSHGLAERDRCEINFRTELEKQCKIKGYTCKFKKGDTANDKGLAEEIKNNQIDLEKSKYTEGLAIVKLIPPENHHARLNELDKRCSKTREEGAELAVLQFAKHFKDLPEDCNFYCYANRRLGPLCNLARARRGDGAKTAHAYAKASQPVQDMSLEIAKGQMKWVDICHMEELVKLLGLKSLVDRESAVTTQHLLENFEGFRDLAKKIAMKQEGLGSKIIEAPPVPASVLAIGMKKRKTKSDRSGDNHPSQRRMMMRKSSTTPGRLSPI